MSKERGRRNFTPSEKVSILKRHLMGKEPVSALCEEYKIQPSQIYQWQREFFERGEAAFERSGKQGKPSAVAERRVAELEAKLQRKNEVLGELMEEHIKLKKSLGEL
jgi:transposase